MTDPKTTEQLIKRLDELYNFVSQDVRNEFAGDMQLIRNELIDGTKLKLIKKLQQRNIALCEIANFPVQKSYGERDERLTIRRMKLIARKIMK